MRQEKILITMCDIWRFKTIQECLERKLKITDASKILKLSYRHTLRLKKKVVEKGLNGLIRISRESPRKIKQERKDEIINFQKRLYWDFNISHFRDKLKECHQIFIGYETLRQILIKADIYLPKKKKKVYRRRRRMPKAGMLVQMDSSEHRWIKDISERWYLITTIDDATNEVAYAKFFPKDTLLANMAIIRRLIELKGRFMALYVDRASHFTTTRHKGVHVQIKPSEEQDDTQIERALKELDINMINAYSPQSKGRIEKLFGFFQDRLVAEMRLVGVKNYDQANQFLVEKFLPWYNKRYTHQAPSCYLPLPKEVNLDTIFCKKIERIVKNDNTISVEGQIIQIPPTPYRLTFVKARVDVSLRENGQVLISYNNAIIAKDKLKPQKRIKNKHTVEEFLESRSYFPIPQKVTFSRGKNVTS